jgi:hypothetical protein
MSENNEPAKYFVGGDLLRAFVYAWNNLVDARAAAQAIKADAGGHEIFISNGIRKGYLQNVVRETGFTVMPHDLFVVACEEAYLERRARREARAARMNGESLAQTPHTGKTEKSARAHARWEQHRRERAAEQASTAKSHRSPGEQLGQGHGKGKKGGKRAA